MKNLLTGLAVTDEDVAKVTERGAAGLAGADSTGSTTDPYQGAVGGKMVVFFRNTFQQTGFTPTEDFKLQLLTNGGFDFGGSTRNVGDDAFPRLVQNLQDSFAMTAWQLVAEGRPFTEVLTTRRFMMTTALKSLYVQIEMPTDSRRHDDRGRRGRSTMRAARSRIADRADQHDVRDEAPVITMQTGTATACRGGDRGRQRRLPGLRRGCSSACSASRRVPAPATAMCCEHASKPYFTADDIRLAWVTINPKATPTDRTPVIQPYDIRRCARRPSCRCRCRASASTRRPRSWRCGTPTTATSTG